MGVNYRKLYEKHHNLKIPKDWEIHHIDANRQNNEPENLIMLPKQLHRALHNYIGLLPRKELMIIRRWYMKKKSKLSNLYLGHKLKQEVKKLNLPSKLIDKNKKYVKNKDRIYDNYLVKIGVKKKLSEHILEYVVTVNEVDYKFYTKINAQDSEQALRLARTLVSGFHTYDSKKHKILQI